MKRTKYTYLDSAGNEHTGYSRTKMMHRVTYVLVKALFKAATFPVFNTAVGRFKSGGIATPQVTKEPEWIINSNTFTDPAFVPPDSATRFVVHPDKKVRINNFIP